MSEKNLHTLLYKTLKRGRKYQFGLGGGRGVECREQLEEGPLDLIQCRQQPISLAELCVVARAALAVHLVRLRRCGDD